MINVNLLPERERKDQGGFLSDGVGGLSHEVVVGIIVAVLGVLLFFHALLGIFAAARIVHYQALNLHWNSMSSDKKAVDGILNEINAFEARLTGLKEITSQQSILWGQMLNEISDNMPRGVWLRALEYDQRVLTLTGSAFSKQDSEMISVGNLAASLKTAASVRKGFASVDVDSIQRRTSEVVSVVDFTLKAKQPEDPFAKGAAKKKTPKGAPNAVAR